MEFRLRSSAETPRGSLSSRVKRLSGDSWRGRGLTDTCRKTVIEWSLISGAQDIVLVAPKRHPRSRQTLGVSGGFLLQPWGEALVQRQHPAANRSPGIQSYTCGVRTC